MRKPKAPRSKAQEVAAHQNIAKAQAARAAERAYDKKHHIKPHLSKKQKQAQVANLAKARAAQERKRHHLKPLPKHPRALAGPSGLLPVFGNDVADVCSAAAIAANLWLRYGISVPDAEVAAAHAAGNGVLGDVLDFIAGRGFGSARLAAHWPFSPGGRALAGSVLGLRLPQGRHAVVALTSDACLSWGSVIPVCGEVEEAWWLEWDTDVALATAYCRC